jgi:hypothetical protein
MSDRAEREQLSDQPVTFGGRLPGHRRAPSVFLGRQALGDPDQRLQVVRHTLTAFSTISWWNVVSGVVTLFSRPARRRRR